MHAISRSLPAVCHTILLSATLNAETDALKQLVMHLARRAFSVTIILMPQVLHNPVTLKLHEEEEEQLLAQCASASEFSSRIVTRVLDTTSVALPMQSFLSCTSHGCGVQNKTKQKKTHQKQNKTKENKTNQKQNKTKEKDFNWNLCRFFV
jgi:hypothetical protein